MKQIRRIVFIITVLHSAKVNWYSVAANTGGHKCTHCLSFAGLVSDMHLWLRGDQKCAG